jgi:hypothetical protein
MTAAGYNPVSQASSPPDPERKQQAEECMAEDAVHFTAEQRSLIEETIREHCRIRG